METYSKINSNILENVLGDASSTRYNFIQLNCTMEWKWIR